MALAGDKYYVQGFCLDNTKTSVQLVQSLFENSISTDSKVIITFKAGAKTSDFASLLPPGISIVDDRNLSQFRIKKLEPKIIKLNTHEIEVYDLENRVLNYLVVQDRESALIETSHHTAMVLFHYDVSDEVKMRNIIDNSKYFKFRTIPLNVFYSFPMVNTHVSLDSNGVNNGISNGGSGLNYITSILSETNAPIYLSKYTPYRMEYSKVLLGFYNELKNQLPDFHIYLEEDRLQESDLIDSNRIAVSLDSLDNLNRRPYATDRDLIDSVASLSIRIQTSDQLKYNYIKNAYQNLNLISNIARFNVKDVHGQDWMTHIEWEPARDQIRMTEIRDDQGRFAYVLDLKCSLYFYVVKDQLYSMILIIDSNYEIMNNGRGLNLLIT